jgi:triosephosphate isomerase (TIM)
MRVPLIAANWKMNTNLKEGLILVREMKPELSAISGIEKVLCPPFISISEIYELVRGSDIKLGAQNIYYQEKGAFTGEISPLMLKDFCEYVIIGHSERRLYFHEDGSLISQKVISAIKNNLKPILCVGENLEQYEAGKTRQVVTEQLASSLDGVENVETLTIAYEPVWAIGTGRAATGEQANETIYLIRSLISKKYDARIAGNIRILYGGSVTAANIAEFVSQPDIDGALVGGASLKTKEFIGIVKLTSTLRAKT